MPSFCFGSPLSPQTGAKAGEDEGADKEPPEYVPDVLESAIDSVGQAVRSCVIM